MAVPRVREKLVRRRRGTAALEFGLCAFPVFLFLLFLFEISYDLFLQDVLDITLHQALRDIQTGNAQNVSGASAFINSYFCPATGGLLNCGNLWIRIQKLPSPLPSTQDFYTYTTGTIPTSGTGKLNLASFGNSTSVGSGNFCNSGPTQMILVSAVYVSPSFIGGLLPGVLSLPNYTDGTLVHATLSTAGVVTEDYPATAAASGSTVAPAC